MNTDCRWVVFSRSYLSFLQMQFQGKEYIFQLKYKRFHQNYSLIWFLKIMMDNESALHRTITISIFDVLTYYYFLHYILIKKVKFLKKKIECRTPHRVHHANKTLYMHSQYRHKCETCARIRRLIRRAWYQWQKQRQLLYSSDDRRNLRVYHKMTKWRVVI